MTMYSGELLSPPEVSVHGPMTEFQARLAHISDELVISDQFRAFDDHIEMPYARDLTLQNVEDLIAFAADPKSSESLFVRLMAADYALNAVMLNHQQSDELREMWEEVLKFNPDIRNQSIAVCDPYGAYKYVDPDETWDVPDDGVSVPEPPFVPGHAKGWLLSIADIEGIPKSHVVPDWYAISGDPHAESDPLPATAYIYLQLLSVIDRYSPRSIEESNPLLMGLLPLARDLANASDQWSFSLTDAKLWESRYAYKEQPSVTGFGNETIERSEAEEYAAAIKELRASAPLLGKIFGDYNSTSEMTEAVERLILESQYALRQHIRNGKNTRSTLPLMSNADSGFPVEFRDDEPLHILRALNDAITGIHEQLFSPDTRTSLAVDGDGFRIYRLWPEGRKGSNLSVYVRPQGAHVYDQDLEYGRNGEGVEASISFVIDPYMPPDSISEIGKHRVKGPDNRVSIRLDLEGIKVINTDDCSDTVFKDAVFEGKPKRDPVSSKTVSVLDIGSVIGDSSWLGTKIGRLLGYGSMQSNLARGVNRPSNLNHLRQRILFEPAERRISAKLDAKLMTSEEISARFSGVQAVAQAQKRR